MCTGRVDISFIFRAFLQGADGVFIGGCWPGECHYITDGNYYALNMVQLAKKILEYAHIDPDRLRLEWLSASEGARFAEVVSDFTKKLKEIGPLGRGKGEEKNGYRQRLEDVKRLTPYIKLVKKEKLGLRPENEEDYKELYTTEEIEKLFGEVISYYIDPEKCRACMICMRRCPVNAIIGGKKRIHVIDQELCIKCGTCYEACPKRFGAVRKILQEEVPPSIPEDERIMEENRR